MNTFLPYPDFNHSAEVLDDRRLGKQRVEVIVLLNCLDDSSRPWHNHPAARMWRGYKNALVEYGLAICLVWIRRGFNDTCYDKILAHKTTSPVEFPPWLGREIFHASHRANLLRKDQHYRQFGWIDSPLLPYEWPV